MATALREYGFAQSYFDYSLFTYVQDDVRISVLVYVDDLVVGGNSSAAVGRLKEYLGRCFHMKDLGALKYFLGIEVSRGSDELLLCQRKYALDIVKETRLLGAKPAPIPIVQNHRLALSDQPFLKDPES